MSAQLTPIEEYIMTAESKPVKVLLWLLRNRDKNGIVHTTLEDAAEACGVTKITVNRVFQRLYKQEFMTKLRNGQYKINRI